VWVVVGAAFGRSGRPTSAAPGDALGTDLTQAVLFRKGAQFLEILRLGDPVC
jgi:hypothetical protein